MLGLVVRERPRGIFPECIYDIRKYIVEVPLDQLILSPRIKIIYEVEKGGVIGMGDNMHC